MANIKLRVLKILRKIKRDIKKECFLMAVVYATLIIKGKKTIHDVPEKIRPQVKQILIDLDLPELAQE